MPQVMLSKHCVRTTFSFVVPPLRIEGQKHACYIKICTFCFLYSYVVIQNNVLNIYQDWFYKFEYFMRITIKFPQIKISKIFDFYIQELE